MAGETFDNRPGVIWYDGKLVPWTEANLHVLSHGLHYASCVFEGERAYGGEIFKSSEHSERLRASAQMIEAGRAKAATCVACHGPEGVAAAPQWPNLAGQHETYLKVAIEHYKDGDRTDLVMNPLIAPLDEESIEELAAFFAAQPHLFSTEP